MVRPTVSRLRRVSASGGWAWVGLVVHVKDLVSSVSARRTLSVLPPHFNVFAYLLCTPIKYVGEAPSAEVPRNLVRPFRDKR